jgi:DNA-binding transcriptional MerR regulator
MEYISYSFKEVCNKTGYKSSVIRYYEKEFNLNIPRDINGRRIFTQNEFDKLIFIKRLQNEGYSNRQIKKILNDSFTGANSEVAVTKEISVQNSVRNDAAPVKNDSILYKYIDERFKELNNTLSELNQNANTKERDILISENLKLKMEIKQKSYEVMELKEKLRYERERSNKGFLKRIFKIK